jgi:hypothetical protein
MTQGEAYLTIETENGKVERIEPQDPKDWAAQISKYAESNDKIKYLRHEGHGLGAGKAAGPIKGQGLIIGDAAVYKGSSRDTTNLADLVESGVFQRAFAENAVIDIRTCYSDFRSPYQTSFCQDIKRALPGATVMGYKGLAFGVTYPRNRIWWLNKPKEVTLR